MTATQRPTRAGYGQAGPARVLRPAPDGRRAPVLRLVRPGEVTPQAQLRRRRLVLAGVVASVCAGLFGLVGEHAILAQQQFRLANLQARTATAAARNQALQLQVAQLESPGRVVSEARSKLGMVPPAGITYLVPGHPGPNKVKGQPAVTPTTLATASAGPASGGSPAAGYSSSSSSSAAGSAGSASNNAGSSGDSNSTATTTP